MLLTSLTTQAQRGYEIGGWLGTAQYYGELNSNVNFVTPGLSGGIIGKYNFNTRVATRLSFNYARVHASDASASNNFERNRNLSFHSNIFDIMAGVEFNFFNYVHNSRDENFTPFITLGLHLMRFDPKAKLDNTTYSLRDMGTEGQEPNREYLLLSGGGTLGIGFKWDIATDINMTVEAAMRFPSTDYLDDVSGLYPNYDELESLRGQEAVDLANRTLNRIAGEEGKQRGNSNNNDKYLMIGISINKYFGRIDCPPISNTPKL